MIKMDKPRKQILLSLIPCAAVLILSLLGGVNKFPFPDCSDYIALSQSLAEDFSFSSPAVPICQRTPGYPFCIMLFSWLGSYGYLVVNLLFIFGITFIAVLAAEKWHVKNYYVLPLLVLLSPGFITLASVPLSEIAFIFFLILSIYLLINDKILLAGFALSAATFCRPIGIFLFLIFMIWLIYHKKKTVFILLFVAGANLLPVFWSIRNKIKYDHFNYTTISNLHLLYYKAGSYLSWKNDVSFDETRNQLSKQLKGDNVFEQSASAGKLGRKILLDNFFGFCLWAPRNMVNFLMPDITPLFERLHIISGNRGTLDILRRKGLWAAFNHYFNNNIPAMIITFVYLAFYSLVFAAILVGVIRLWIEKHYSKLIFGTMLVAYFWVLPIGNLDWRFRMPIMPILFIVAIYGAEGFYKWLQTSKFKINILENR
jgi:hypothetical protein